MIGDICQYRIKILNRSIEIIWSRHSQRNRRKNDWICESTSTNSSSHLKFLYQALIIELEWFLKWKSRFLYEIDKYVSYVYEALNTCMLQKYF